MNEVIWHDIECGTYTQDLAMWLEMTKQYGAPVLDIGAGTGRVALTLARAGHAVVAVDRDPALLVALAARAEGLPVETVAADARELSLGRRFPFCIVPMQTVQLLGGTAARTAFLARVRDHLEPGGTIALAITTTVEEFEWRDGDALPLPDIVELDGTVYSSQPVAVRADGPVVVLERLRETILADGSRQTAEDRIELHRITATGLAAEGAAAGLQRAGVRIVPATDEHVGSEVVLLAAPTGAAATGRSSV